METLYLSDLDGTLLNTKAQLPPYSRQVLTPLVEAGLMSFASARELNSLRQVLDPLPLRLPLILANGAFIVDPKDARILYARHFDPALLETLAPLLLRPGLCPIVYARQDDGLDYGRVRRTVRFREGPYPEGTAHYFSKRPGDPRFEQRAHHEAHYPHWLLEGKVHCINLIDEEAVLRPLYEALKATGQVELVFQQELYRPEWWLALYPLHCNKGTAASWLCEALGAKRLVVFGDGINDLPLFETALETGGEAYAVAQAHPKLQAIATALLPSNEDEGVAHFLEAHVLPHMKSPSQVAGA